MSLRGLERRGNLKNERLPRLTARNDSKKKGDSSSHAPQNDSEEGAFNPKTRKNLIPIDKRLWGVIQ